MIEKSGHDHRVDIWSIGILAFELMAGRPPFIYKGEHNALYSEITGLRIKWSNELTDLAKSFVSMILKVKPEERLTLDEMLSHPWLASTPTIREVLVASPLTKEESIAFHLIHQNVEKKSVETEEHRSSVKESIRNSSSDLVDLQKRVSELQEELEKNDLQLSEMNKRMQKFTEEDESKRVKENERLDLLMEIEVKDKKIFSLESDLSVLSTERSQLEKTVNSLNIQLEEKNKKYKAREAELNDNIERLREQVLEKERELSKKESKIRLSEINKIDQNQGNSEENINILVSNYLSELRELTQSKIKQLEKNILEKEEENCKFRLESIQGINISVEELNTELRLKYKKMLEEERKLRHIGEESSASQRKNKTLEWYKTQLSELVQYKNNFSKNEREVERLAAQLKVLREQKEVVEEKNEFFSVHIGSLSDNVKKLKNEKDKYKNAFRSAEELFNKYNKKNLRELINFSQIYN